MGSEIDPLGLNRNLCDHPEGQAEAIPTGKQIIFNLDRKPKYIDS